MAYKICTIGRSHVGKTSLIIRLIYDKFSDVDATIGVSFLTKKYTDQTMLLHFWDTAGQERFDSMLPSYLRDAHVILICSDANTKEDLELDVLTYMKKIPTSSSGTICDSGTNIIVCSTKTDSGITCNSGATSSSEMLKTLELYEPLWIYCESLGLQYATTSSKTGWGIEGLEKAILNICSRTTITPSNNHGVSFKINNDSGDVKSKTCYSCTMA
jgi:small GTP-binding protein